MYLLVFLKIIMDIKYQKNELFLNQQEHKKTEKILQEEIRKKITIMVKIKQIKLRMKYIKKF